MEEKNSLANDNLAKTRYRFQSVNRTALEIFEEHK
jgi:hypothetical protein